jgi:dipeptidyl aminopeptidase/acylaminoacyl peptidase
MRRIAILCGVLVLGASAAEAQFTLEQVFSAPFPTSLTASPDGSRVAWVFDEQGARNVWAADAPGFAGSRLTAFEGDDGTTIHSLAFSRDGSRIAFIRGDGPNRAGELPNPTSDPAGVEQALWVLEGDGAPRRITAPAASPLFTADGDAVLFVRRGRVWRVGLGADAEPEQLIHGRGSFGNLRLAPNGDRLAFVSSRGAHSFVGVYDFGAKTVHYLDPAVDRDGSPAFSPDGSSIAFVRQPPILERYLFVPQREGSPWSVQVVDLDGAGMPSRAREIFRASEGKGSVFSGTASANQLHWTGDGRILFPWERTGYRHYYAVSAAGGEPDALTSGSFEVEYAVRDGEGGLIAATNQDDIDRRHLWRLTAGAAAEALTSGTGVETLPVAVQGGVAFLGGDGRRPLQPMVQTGGEARALAPDAFPADFPLDHMVDPEPVVFASADGMEIHGQLFRPAEGAETPGPGVLFLHGGSRRQMLLGWHYMGYYSNCYAFHQYLASRGYTVISVNYRSGTGYGMEFREALNYGASGGAEHQDVLGAGRTLADMPGVDGDRIGLWGGSYGGYLTAMGLSRASDLFAAGVDIHGVHDWNRTIQGFVPSYEPDHHPEQARLAFESSPLSTVDGWRSPVLLVHGDDDRNVPFNETVELVEKLRELGVEHELLIFPDEIHGFLRHENWLEVFRRSADFFERHLGK